MKDFKVTEKIGTDGIKIVVIGVGGGGSNMVDNLVQSDIADKVKLVAINTDAQALKNSKVPHKLQIGKKITDGKGAGMNPEVGKASAMESYDEIKDMLMKFSEKEDTQ
ncbi:protein containing Tubulin/FtsZ, GTPase domain [Sulfurimonas gotlandica GD1]|uniref:Protein containing Tubulin/FtsZ, GTPase domain n=1 Tax=Sulfurimonas gotlandica (strain DSM 19862 / JCM 16533 / GD1) TaxID=929558 RepID=B6BJ66_SULGG|nr:cell division protein FtsZ [Sulfurimonas gotlandica GD1]EHP30581.1 protein containing Tubulin/FtsZ, GTPase domain [Sulfurimonas gotlandica GD1]